MCQTVARIGDIKWNTKMTQGLLDTCDRDHSRYILYAAYPVNIHQLFKCLLTGRYVLGTGHYNNLGMVHDYDY